MCTLVLIYILNLLIRCFFKSIITRTVLYPFALYINWVPTSRQILSVPTKIYGADSCQYWHYFRQISRQYFEVINCGLQTRIDVVLGGYKINNKVKNCQTTIFTIKYFIIYCHTLITHKLF